MRYLNSRYGNPEEMRFYARGMPLQDLARQLRRDKKTVRDWLSGRRKVPFWVPELLRLRHREHHDMMRSMGMRPLTVRVLSSTGLRGSLREGLPARPLPADRWRGKGQQAA